MKDKKNQVDEKKSEVEIVETFSTSIKSGDELGNYISRFFKVLDLHKWLFITIQLIITLIIVSYGLKQPTIYQSEYEVFYNETIREFVDDKNVPYIKSDFDKNYWLRVMESDELKKAALKASGLSYEPYEFTKMIEVGVMDKRKEDRIPVFSVRINSKLSQHIPIIIKAYIQSLNESLLTKQVQNSERLVSYLNKQIDQNNVKLNEINIQITNETGQKGEIVDFDKIKMSIDEFRKNLLNASVNLASIKSSRIKTEIELRNLDGTIVNESAFSEPLKVQLMNLQVDLSRALTKNKEDHPSVKQIRQNIGQISKMLHDSIEQRLEIKSLIQNPLKSQLLGRLVELQISEVAEETRVSSLKKVIAELEKQSLPGSVNEEQQQTLRNRDMISLTIKQLNDKLIETQTTSHGSLSRFVFIDDQNSVFLSNKGLIYYLILGLLLGFVIASLVVFLYDLIDDRIMLIDDYEHFYKYPMLGIIRHYQNKSNTVIETIAGEKVQMNSDIGSLIVNLRQITKQNEIKTIVISSPNRQEGKSLVSLKLGCALAIKKQKVLLVDIDFFSPKLSNNMAPGMKMGLSNFIQNEITISEIIQHTEIETLDFVGAGNAEGQKELFYNDKNLVKFVEWAKENYDIILFDTPAAMYIPDIVEFFDHMDSIMIIVRLRHTTRKLLSRLFKTVSIFQSKYVGVFLNDLVTTGAEKYSNYSYSYSYANYKDSSNEPINDKKKKRSKKIIIFSIILSFILLIFASSLIFPTMNIFKMPMNFFTKAPKAVMDTISYNNINADSILKNTEVDDSIPKGELIVRNNYLDSIIVAQDTRLTLLSLFYYGNKSFWVYIYEVNKTKIKDPNKLEIGKKIYIPKPEDYDIDANSPNSIKKAIEFENSIKSELH